VHRPAATRCPASRTACWRPSRRRASSSPGRRREGPTPSGGPSHVPDPRVKKSGTEKSRTIQGSLARCPTPPLPGSGDQRDVGVERQQDGGVGRAQRHEALLVDRVALLVRDLRHLRGGAASGRQRQAGGAGTGQDFEDRALVCQRSNDRETGQGYRGSDRVRRETAVKDWDWHEQHRSDVHFQHRVKADSRSTAPGRASAERRVQKIGRASEETPAAHPAGRAPLLLARPAAGAGCGG